ncbi:MAG: DNA repair protein RecN [Bacillus thermozeamaize]|uniref:DNA repair protein RecN n=1 Tax=Bacillus thermozeamaize TaxID=230954 RepID=A0A1Y3PBW5_9BACI|nr:MAG: DNA repair protein RecN [Bacillus thermozeamaize]
MLEELHIRQFVTFEELHLRFGRGLHILTGESGAGKSVILDALQLLMGQRASADYIRQGAEKSYLEALFTYHSTHPVRELLAAAGIAEEVETDGENGECYSLILQREITRQGRSTCRVNGHLVPLSLLRRLGEVLVNVYRQQESHTLNDLQVQRQWLDSLLPEEGKAHLQEYRKWWEKYRDWQQEYQHLLEREKQWLHQQDLYRYQLEEIRNASLEIGEEERLAAEQKILSHAEKIQYAMHSAYHALAASQGATDQLGKALADLEQIVHLDSELKPLIELLNQAYYATEEAIIQLRRKKETFHFDPHRLHQIEERVSLIQHLKRKYGDSIEAILSYARQIEAELAQLDQREERLAVLKRSISEAEQHMAMHAEKLSRFRRRLAEQLTEQIQAELNQLQLGNMRFLIQVLPRREGGADAPKRRVFDAQGMDEVLFLVSPYAGAEPLPISKVASGGELSRLMLALKTVFSSVVFSETKETTTIVFDEIDTGISGQSAQAVAEKLIRLSREHQVLCISHLPQVVCMADAHYLVQKEIGENGVTSGVRLLDRPERIQALARMLEGDHTSELSLQHAENMLRRAEQFKQTMWPA